MSWKKDDGSKATLIEVILCVVAVVVMIFFRPQLKAVVDGLLHKSDTVADEMGANVVDKPYVSDKAYFEEDPHFILNMDGEYVGQCYDHDHDDICDYCGANMYDREEPTVIILNPDSSDADRPTVVVDAEKPHMVGYRVTGIATDESGVRTVYVSIDGSEYAEAVFDYVTDQWYYDITLYENVRTTVCVYAKDYKGNHTAILEHYVIYDTTAPMITITDPTEDPKYIGENRYTICGKIDDTGVGVDQATITYIDATGVQITDDVILGADGSFAHTSSTLRSGVITTFIVDATDRAGLMATPELCRIYCDATAPVVAISPAYTSTSASNPCWLTSKSFTMSGIISDVGSGLASVSYKYPWDTEETTTTYTKEEHKTSVSLAESTQNLAEGTVYSYGATGVDHVGRTTRETYYIRLDATEPAISAPFYNGMSIDSYISMSSPYTTEEGSGVVSCTVTDVDGSGVSTVTINGVTASRSGDVYSATITLTADSTNSITITATDVAGNEGSLIRYVYYNTDSTAPTITVNTLSSNSSSPTYTQSDANISNYAVTGTWSDPSGISYIKVNGYSATVNEDGTWSCSIPSLETNASYTITTTAADNSVKKNATGNIDRYLRVECFYQQAERIAGTDLTTSLDAMLKNSTICNTIAGNATARSIVNTKYRASVASYVETDSTWSEGLNTLAYNTSNVYYLYHLGSTNIWDAGFYEGWSGTCPGKWSSSKYTENNNKQVHIAQTEKRQLSVANGQGTAYTESSGFSYTIKEAPLKGANPDRIFHTTWPVMCLDGNCISLKDNQYYGGVQGQANKGFTVPSGYTNINIVFPTLQGYYTDRNASGGLSTGKSVLDNNANNATAQVAESTFYSTGLFRKGVNTSGNAGTSTWNISSHAGETLYFKMQAKYGGGSVSYIYFTQAAGQDAPTSTK